MFCDESLDALEAIAAGELTPEGRIAQHLASCRNCAAALAAARQLEGMLRARAVPKPSQQFTTRTMARVRRARWRTEQVLDVGFNVALALVVLGIAGGVLMMLNVSGLSSVGTEAAGLFSTGFVTVARRVAPALPIYGAATALVATVIGIWWWAERDTAR